MTFALLEGLKVLDLGTFAAGLCRAKLFADAGADVIHVERLAAGAPTAARLGLGPWVLGRIKAHAPDAVQQLKQRPGPPPAARDAAPSRDQPRSTI